MGKMTPEEALDRELQASYAEFTRLEKSRRDDGGNAPEDFNHEPGLPQNMRGASTQEQRADNRRYVDTQYGDTEPRDPEDEEAERVAADRQRRVFGGEDDADLARSRRKKTRDDDDDDDDDDDQEDFEKAMRMYRAWKKSQRDAATRAIESDQDAYLRDQRGRDGLGGHEEDDIHGEPEDFPDGRFGMPDPDDQTQITNMGRRVKGAGSARKSLSTAQDFYQDALDATGYSRDVWDANQGLAALADVLGSHLDKSTRVIANLADRLAKSEARQARMEAQLTKSLQAQTVTLQGQRAIAKSLAAIEEQPVDLAPPGVVLWPGAQTAPNGQPARGKGKGAKPKSLTKSQVRGTLTKAMRAGAIESSLLVDFDNAMIKQMAVPDWLDTALDEDQRAALGL